MPSPHAILTTDHERWRSAFDFEADALKRTLGAHARAVEHIGSTAVEGLAAKPIVDIAVLIERKADADSLVEPLAALGYEFSSKSSERHFFIKEVDPRVHLSIAYADFSRYFERQLLFRDHLRANPTARAEYQSLKEQLLAQDPSGESTSVGKTEFVVKVLEEAGFSTSGDW